MSARIATPAADTRAAGALDSGKGRGGQSGADSFGGVLADLDQSPSNAAETAAGDPDLALQAGGFAMTATSFSTRAPGPSTNQTTVAVAVFDVTGIVAAATASVPADNVPGKLFQALVDGTTQTKAQIKDQTAEASDEAGHTQSPEADPTGLAAMLAMPALATVPTLDAGRSGDAQAALSTKLLASAPGAGLDGDLAANDKIEAPPISDVKIETHIAVAASPSVAADTASAAPRAEATDAPALSADALQAMSGPARSVAQAVQELLPDKSVPAAPVDTATASVAPARTMTLQLNPANLGTVEVRLHLTGQSLDLQLSVSNKETLGVISRDRGHLETALAGQNYDLRSLVIQGTGASGGAGDPQAGPQGQGAGTQGDQGRSQNQGTSAFGQDAGGSGGDRRPTQPRGKPAHEAVGVAAARSSGASRAGGLFV